MTRSEIKIDPTLNVWAVQEKAEKIAARAIKKGLSGGYTVNIETRTEEGPKGPVEMRYLIIEGEPAQLNGYTFVALVEWIGEQPVVTGSPYYEGAPVDRSKIVKGGCDHCGVNRQRKSVVIVETADGERKQVGKSCVKDYLGNTLALSWFKSAGDIFEEFDGYTGYGSPLEQVIEILSIAACVVRTRGWVSRTNASILDKTATADLVDFWLGPAPSKQRNYYEWVKLREGFDITVDVPAAKAALEFAKTLPDTSDWAANLKAVVSQDYFNTQKHLGLVVSLAGVYARSLQKEAEEAADPVVEEPFGTVGERITVELKVVSSTAFETDYGLTYANTFTGEGHRFKWLTGTRSFEEGDTVTLKGTIKKYDEWNDKVFTVLTRCKEVAA
jgi:hypothetical protein